MKDNAPMTVISRRHLLLSLPGLALAPRLLPRAFAQTGPPALRVRSINHIGLAVSDPKRSVEFYQGLFGMPVRGRQGSTTLLQLGSGPQFIAIAPMPSGATPSITHYCLGVEGFNVDRGLAALAAQGVTKADAVGPMKAHVSMRGPEANGAKDGTPELNFGDPDGIVCQLQDASYCGGAGALGNVCAAGEPSPKKGLMALRDLSHLTIFSTDSQRSNKFYQDLCGFSIRSFQGPTAPTLAVGPTVEFLMFTGGGGAARGGAPAAPPRPASINHACMNMDAFKPDDVLKALESYGLKPREGAQGPVGPLRHYVSMRMENRGGAPEGTPELYFTDPDGLLMQLQDVKYCGGSGYLGDVCR
jgi:catechol 2,3-dioxygenase-like lactoylglutathione lyase family enzyme